MEHREAGFTLVELIAIMVIIGVIAITASARFASTDVARLQSSRDDLIAALFFAQQTAMARSSIDNVIAVEVSPDSISVNEDGTPISVHQSAYPLSFASGVSVAANPSTFSYDKLGRTTGGIITLSIGGNSATVNVDGSGYAYYD